MEIPSFLQSQIRDGKVVLGLGAGASRESKNSKGQHPPTGEGLRDLLSDRFLGGKYKTLPLSQVSEYAISETDLVTVQTHIRDIFQDFKTTDAHIGMSSLYWWGVFTTNYDLLIEEAYFNNGKRVQQVRPFIQNGDRVDLQTGEIMMLKLHGCITRASDSSCPLILTTDQYVEYRANRSRIFAHLTEWGYEHPVVFVGQSLQDPDLRAILLELATSSESRPRYYIVSPDVDDIRARFWETKKITVLKGTFAEFIQAAAATESSPFQGLAVEAKRAQLPLADRVSSASLSSNCLQFLDRDVDYVKGITATEPLLPKSFYKGISLGFSSVEQGLDVHRHLADTILSDNFLIEEAEHQNRMELILVKAHAGAGKSVLLHRIAWDASHDYGCLCIFLRSSGLINPSAIQELISTSRERVFLFVDDATDHARELQALAKSIGPEGKQLTVVAAERINEWNVSGSQISFLVTSEYELKYLSTKEIDDLLVLLEKHKALGTLEHVSAEVRKAAFAERAGRQLLVALHEATLGKRFEEIIEDEFNHIEPYEAKRIYLSICVLNRLSVPVRAGIVSRIHGVPFEEFRERLFGPLENIVTVEKDDVLRDYVYRARHPHIAQIVFERILRNQEERFDAFIKCLSNLNIDFSPDRQAFRQMVRGRVLLELFPNHQLVVQIYDAAKTIADNDGYLQHQMALYEMHRPNGDLNKAAGLLATASQLAPWDSSIKHSMAELRVKLADTARTPLEREKQLREAAEISNGLRLDQTAGSYGYHTLAKIGVRRLKEKLDSNVSIDAQELTDLIKEIERNLTEGLQKSPGDSYLLETESQFAEILADSKRSVDALKKAFDANPRSTFIAVRLSQFHTRLKDYSAARTIMEKALEANNGERRLHYAYARLLLDEGSSDGQTLIYHLRRSFTPGDSNYDAQLLYGRQLFINGDRDESRKVFKVLGAAPLSLEVREKLLYPLSVTYRGHVIRMEAGYFWIAREGSPDWVYCHRNDIDDGVWKEIRMLSRVTFRIAFTLRGPNAVDVRVEEQRKLMEP